MRIHLAADHAGFELKEAIKSWLKELGYDIHDEGAFSYDPDDDYPDMVKVLALQVASEPEGRGLIFAGSGQGEAMMANRFKGIRAAVYYGPAAPHQAVDITGRITDDALAVVRLSREHNNANILSIGARFVKTAETKEAIKLWLNTTFSGDERHIRRLDKIDDSFSNEEIFDS